MTLRKPCAFINARSGSTDDVSDAIRSKLEAKFDEVGPVDYIDPAKLSDGIEAALSDGCDLVIVYGGDGTALTAARLATEKDVPIVALPGGTMNLLPKALYATEDWEEALDKALDCDTPRWMAAGRMGEDMFLCGCMIGTPTRLNDVREQLRDHNFIKAIEDLVFNIMDFDAEQTFEYALGRAPSTFQEANLLNIACPQTSSFDTGRGALEVNSIDVDGIGDAASLGLSAVASDWREDDSAQTNISDRVHVRGDGAVDVLLDGEAKRLDLPLEITITRKGVLVLAP